MFKNYFKTAWRNLVKTQILFIHQYQWLTVGLAVGILILLWVQDEFSFDRFHKNVKNIYKLENMVGTGSSRQLWTVTAAPIGVLAKKEIPGVKDEVRISDNGYYELFKYKDKVFSEQNNLFTDPSLFSMFDFKLIKGNTSNPFPDTIRLCSQKPLQKNILVMKNAIGKVITADDKINFKVTGVIKDFPKNSTIQSRYDFPNEFVGEKYVQRQYRRKKY